MQYESASLNYCCSDCLEVLVSALECLEMSWSDLECFRVPWSALECLSVPRSASECMGVPRSASECLRLNRSFDHTSCMQSCLIEFEHNYTCMSELFFLRVPVSVLVCL